MRISRDCWQCEYPDCGHVWLAAGDEAPNQCAKCKRRKWNTPGSVEPVGIEPLLPVVKDSGDAARLIEAFRKKREGL